MQLVSPQLRDGRGLDYVAGSYRVIGNNGTAASGGVISATGTMSQSVVSALGTSSDHLPVATQYAYRLFGDATGDDKIDCNGFLTPQNRFDAARAFDQGDFEYEASSILTTS